MRAILANLVNEWNNTLDVAQREAWQLYASQVPITNRLGDSIFLSGQNMFIRTNSVVDQIGAVAQQNAPTQFDTGDAGTVTLDSVTALTDAIGVAFDNTQAWANDDDGFLAIYVSRPQNPSINFMKGPFRLAGTIDGDAITPPTSPATLTSPFPIAADQRVWIRTRAGIGDGRLTGSLVLGPEVAV